MTPFSSLALKVDSVGVWVLDQTQLPGKEVWLASPTVDSMVQHIRDLKVRGAPLIGVAASLQIGWLAEKGMERADLERAILTLREARPTAVNLMHAMDRLLVALNERGPKALVVESERLCEEDVQLCQRLSEHAASLIEPGDQILTHCNTGGLATAGKGTALGGIIQAHQEDKRIHVYVDETRPLLQGGRLTAWELSQHRVPQTLICDNMAAQLMALGKISRVFVGADRIARNGDFANKVGTYGLAVLSKFHGVPFFVVAPQTTVDVECEHGAQIPIEQRTAAEVRGVRGSFGAVTWAPETVDVYNPAFDVTPESLVTGWVLDRGIFTREDVKRGALCGQ